MGVVCNRRIPNDLETYEEAIKSLEAIEWHVVPHPKRLEALITYMEKHFAIIQSFVDLYIALHIQCNEMMDIFLSTKVFICVSFLHVLVLVYAHHSTPLSI